MGAFIQRTYSSRDHHHQKEIFDTGPVCFDQHIWAWVVLAIICLPQLAPTPTASGCDINGYKMTEIMYRKADFQLCSFTDSLIDDKRYRTFLNTEEN
jgi:hypothetical protein